MKLASLEAAVRAHAGEFYCERIQQEHEKKVVHFRHAVSPPAPIETFPDVGRLGDFYETFGSVVFYVDDKSGEAARYIASPADWAALHSEFMASFNHLDKDERAEFWPD